MNALHTKKPGMALIFILLILNSACESNAVRHEEAFEKHPQWSEQDKQLISQGMINYGMSKAQVRAAWGKYCKSCPGTKKFETGRESWEYQTQVVFFDKEGKVIRWVKR
jgi:hypothetical protein